MHTEKKLEYGLIYQIFFMIISFIVFLIFTNISYLVIRFIIFDEENLKRHRIHKPMITVATIYWITIAISSLLDAIFLNNLIIPFHQSCIDNISCFQCTLTRNIKTIMLFGLGTSALLIFTISLKQNFQPLAANKSSWIMQMNMLQIWIIVLMSTFLVYQIVDSEAGLSHLSDTKSKKVCIEYRAVLTGSNPIIVVTGFGTLIINYINKH